MNSNRLQAMATTRNRKRAKSAQHHSVDSHALFEVLHVCSFNAGMQTEETMSLLARLATSSNQLRDVVKCMVMQHIGELLPLVAAAAHTAQKNMRGPSRWLQPTPQQTSQAAEFARTLAHARWLCSLAGQQALQQHSAAILSVHRVPTEVAVVVQQAGLQLTTENLVAAARLRVEGLESWVGEPYCSGLEPVVLALMTGRVHEVRTLLQASWQQPECSSVSQLSMLDLMHLAINQQRPEAAAMLFAILLQQRTQLHSMQQQLEQQTVQQLQPQQRRVATRRRARSEQQQHDLAQQVQQLQQRLQAFDQEAQGYELEQLLETAVARRHAAVAADLCSLPAASQLPGEAILQLLHRSVVHKRPVYTVTELLLQLAAAADAAAAAEAAGLAKAAACDDDDDVGRSSCCDQQPLLQQPRQLLSGAAAQQQLLQLLEVAVSRANSHAVRLLLEQQALQGLDAAACRSLAWTAVELRDGATLAELCRLPGLRELPAPNVEQLLGMAVQLRSLGSVQQLAGLPHAAALRPARLASMLEAALQPDSYPVARVLLHHPAAQNISVEDATHIADAALAAPTAFAACDQLRLVCRLPAAAQLPPSTLMRLLRSAMKLDGVAGGQAVAQLCALTPAVLGLAADDVEQLLSAAALAGRSAMVPALCQLPAASQLQADALYGVLQTALSASKPAASSVLGQLCNGLAGAAQQLQPQQVLNLLSRAMNLVGCGMGLSTLRVLLRLPAAQQMQPDDVSTLVSLALHTPQADDLLRLLLACLPAAKQMDASQLLTHVVSALEMGELTDAAALLALPAAAAVSHDDVATLLLQLFDQLRSPGCLPKAMPVFALLCELPTAQHIPPQFLVQVVQQLLQLMGRLRELFGDNAPSFAWLQRLLALQPGQQLSAAYVEHLMQLALQQQQLAAVPLLCRLPAAEQLEAAAIQYLLSIALTSSAAPAPAQYGGLDRSAGSSRSSSSSSQALAVSCLCKLPGTQQIRPEVYAVLLHSALHQGQDEVLRCLPHSGAPASEIEKGVLLELLRTAIKRMSGKGVTHICNLLAEHGLSRSEAAALLSLNEQMGHALDTSLVAKVQALVR